jgi:malate dehydrogenase (oxaloacetate-decarboxylating)(NADP+)
VAVISNGTAVLGLGDLGALASKPVMEGKAVLFKRFADIDAMDLEVDTDDVDKIINAVRYLGPSFGGINLEDIKAPECFIIEQQLREMMDIPVFHDDQHGPAIITPAGPDQRAALTGRTIKGYAKIVVERRGAASIACVELDQAHGPAARPGDPVRHQGRDLPGPHRGHEQWKSAHAVVTSCAPSKRRWQGADVLHRPVGQGTR